MKTLITRTVALAMLSGIALHAQNMTGSWQGTLQPRPGTELRIVIKVSMADDALKATLYSIDQGGQPLPSGSFTLQGSTVKMTVPAIGGSYEGKLSADGNTIMGTWTQGPMPQPLNLKRATPETAWAIPEPPPPPVRMAANANPGVEVATIKPSDPDRPGKLFTVKGQMIVTINTTLNDLITMAYNLHSKQVTGGPAWIDSDKFDLNVKPDVPGQPNVTQLKAIIQKVLTDRFQLKFHREKKELTAYAIVPAKSGVKITKSEADVNGLPGLFFGRAPSGVSFNVRNATLAEVANVLQGSVLDKPVVDQSGLSGKYDFTLRFTPDSGQMAQFGGPQPPAASDPDSPPDLFAAFQQQLGLRLESSKTPVDVLVIDRVEKPSEN